MIDDRFDAPVLLYGILAADALTDDALTSDVLGGVQGVDAQSVTLVEGSGFAVLVSPVPDPDRLRAPEAEDALAHKSVVDAVFAHRTVIPVRFGTTAASPAELDELLAGEAEAYRGLLDRLDGYAEMGVRLTLREERAPASAPSDTAYRADRPGTAYLLARQRQRDAQDGHRRRAARAYRTALADWAERTVTSSRRSSDDTVSLAFLVARTDADAFRDAVARVDAPGVTSVDVVGPWAPYSFV